MNFFKKTNVKENQRGILTSINLLFPLYSTRTLQVNIFLKYLHNLKS